MAPMFQEEALIGGGAYQVCLLWEELRGCLVEGKAVWDGKGLPPLEITGLGTYSLDSH